LPKNQVHELSLFTGEAPASALCAKPTENESLFEFVDASLEGIGLMVVTSPRSARTRRRRPRSTSPRFTV
jgi:hypothetical protein